MTNIHNNHLSSFSRRDALALAGAASFVFASAHLGLSSAFAGYSHRQQALNIRLPDQLASQNPIIEGKLPASLRGTYYKNGPALRQGFSRSYKHWFDGDGFIQAFRFNGSNMQHHGQFVHTEKYNAENDAGDYFFDTFSHNWVDSAVARSSDEINVANTNIVHHGDRLMALWEAGSAWQINQENLDSIAKVKWHDDLATAPFSAHPHIDDDGSLWNFGQVPWSQKMILYHINPDGRLNKYNLLDMPNTSMIHDFAITKNFLILLLPPLTWELDRAKNNASFLNAHQWHEDRPVEILIVDKNDLSVLRRHHIPTAFHFHIGSAFEADDGTIELDLCHYKNADIVFNLHLNKGEKDLALPPMNPHHNRVTLSPNRNDGKVTRIHNYANEFPRTASVADSHRSQHSWSIGIDTETGLFRYALGVNLETGKVDQYDYGANCLLEEHIFVADNDRPTMNGIIPGWLIGLHLDLLDGKTKLAVLDAYDLAAGPQAIVTLPYGLPPGLHGNFVSAA
ncbi:MAG: hypothetical protein HON06_10240 [Candidatus Puniceispirillum sp.]|nr:hypothetical protein [Candidatus Puniceispirillum sp.]